MLIIGFLATLLHHTPAVRYANAVSADSMAPSILGVEAFEQTSNYTSGRRLNKRSYNGRFWGRDHLQYANSVGRGYCG